jgi:hypothetical protein
VVQVKPRSDWLRSLHLVIGIAGVFVFLGTGQFMDRTLDHLRGMPDGPRALYRSGHIYILFSALLNMLLGAYMTRPTTAAGRWIQYAGSLLLVGALGFFIAGFFIETPLALVERPMVRRAIVWSLVGAALHTLVGFAVSTASPVESAPAASALE